MNPNLATVLAIALLSGVVPACAAEETAEELLDEFRATDWESRAKMAKPDPGDDAWRLRVRAEHGLAHLGDEAVPALLDALSDESSHLRGLAAQCLGIMGDESALQALASVLAEDPRAMVRVYAAEALGRIGGEEARAPLARCIEDDGDGNVTFAAKTALKRLTDGPPCGDSVRSQARSLDDLDSLELPTVGQPAPEIDLVSDSGEHVRLSDFRGESPVVLLFQLADW